MVTIEQQINIIDKCDLRLREEEEFISDILAHDVPDDYSLDKQAFKDARDALLQFKRLLLKELIEDASDNQQHGSEPL